MPLDTGVLIDDPKIMLMRLRREYAAHPDPDVQDAMIIWIDRCLESPMEIEPCAGDA